MAQCKCSGIIIEVKDGAYCDNCKKSFSWCEVRQEYIDNNWCLIDCNECEILSKNAKREE